MLLPSGAADPAEAIDAAPRLGLRTLIAAAPRADAAAAGANVATRTMAASRRAVCGGGGEDEGCWVSYGWRHRLRRLPPPMPAHRALARARTPDGRLVISREEPAHRVCGRKVDDRLVLELLDRHATPAPPPPQLRRWSLPLTVGHEATAPPVYDDGDDKEAAAAAEDGATVSRAGALPASSAQAQAPTTEPPVGPGSPAPAVACFEGAIRAASLCATPMSLPRMDGWCTERGLI